MRPFTALTLALIAAATLPATAAERVSAENVAAQAGYSLRWLGPERSVSLSRPGIAIVLRPGSVLYDVNTHEEVTDLAPIVTASGDLLISSSLASRLRLLAHRADLAVPHPSGEVAAVAAPMHGAIALDARQLEGQLAFTLRGEAPPNARITITLLGTFASDLPTVLLSRQDVQSDVNGRFETVVSAAPADLPGTFVTITATSSPGIAPATVRVTLQDPNAGAAVPVEFEP